MPELEENELERILKRLTMKGIGTGKNKDTHWGVSQIWSKAVVGLIDEEQKNKPGGWRSSFLQNEKYSGYSKKYLSLIRTSIREVRELTEKYGFTLRLLNTYDRDGISNEIYRIVKKE